jgi:UDP:flavonoid glycosyltransferase YjiC (YdhE family)
VRVLFTSVPAPSHIDPLLPLAHALGAADHEVAIATGPALVPRVERAGLRAVATGLDWSEPEADRTFPELRDLPLREMERWWVRNIFFDRHANPMADDVGALLDAEPFDVVVRPYIEFGGWAAATVRDLPQVVFQLGQAWQAEQLPIVGQLLEPVLGRLDPSREVDPNSVYGDGLLLLHPASYDDWTPPTRWFRTRPPVPFPPTVTGSPTAGAPEGVPPANPAPPLARPPRPEVLDGAPDDQPVALVTFGTVFNRTPGAFEVVLEALSDLPLTAVVTVGTTRDPAELGPAPANVQVRRFVPYTELLPHCDLVVGHGGFSTVMLSLAHGVPVVVIPLGSDQPWHGANTQTLGLGEMVAFEGITAGAVRTAVTTVLEDPGYRQRATAYRDELLALQPAAEAARWITELASEIR